MQCKGTEQRLIDCPVGGNNLNCRHREDAGVRCEGELTMCLQLRGVG